MTSIGQKLLDSFNRVKSSANIIRRNIADIPQTFSPTNIRTMGNNLSNAYQSWQQKPSNTLVRNVVNYQPQFKPIPQPPRQSMFPQRSNPLINVLNAGRVQIGANARSIFNETGANQAAMRYGLKTGRVTPFVAGNPFIPMEQRTGQMAYDPSSMGITAGGITSNLTSKGSVAAAQLFKKTPAGMQAVLKNKAKQLTRPPKPQSTVGGIKPLGVLNEQQLKAVSGYGESIGSMKGVELPDKSYQLLNPKTGEVYNFRSKAEALSSNVSQAPLSAPKGVGEITQKLTDKNLTSILEDGKPQNGVLSDLIDYPELFKKYPELKNIPVKIEDIPGEAAHWDRTNQRLVISPASGGAKGFYDNLMHELQHLIQQKEGMVGGGIKEGMSPEAYKAYLNLPGEVQAREASKTGKIIFKSAPKGVGGVKPQSMVGGVTKSIKTLQPDKRLGIKSPTTTANTSSSLAKQTQINGKLSGLPTSQKVSISTKQNQQALENIITEGRKQIGTTKPEGNKPIRQIINDAYTQWVDRYNPIIKASQKAKSVIKSQGAALRPEYDPEYLVRRLTGAGGIADARFRNELKPIIDQVDTLKIPKADLDVYLANKRIAGFGQVGREVYGADPNKAQRIIGALEAKYGQNIRGVADQLYTYQNKGFQEMVDAGFISPQNAQLIKQQNPDYSPLYRVMDEVNDYLGLPTRKTMQGSQPVLKIKGSKRLIESPIESIMGNTFSQRAAIEKNRVAKSIVGLQQIADMGFTPAAKSSDSTITIWNNGMKEYWNVGKDIADVAKGTNEEAMNMVLKIIQAPASLLRQGATGRNPEFMLPNIIRDQLDAGVTSKYGYIPFIDYLSGLKSMVTNDDIYKAWERSGAKIDLGEMSGKKSIAQYFDSKTAKKGLFGWIGSGLDLMGKYSEQPTRVGLFKKAYQKTGNDLIAAMESRDATVDFARMGSKMKTANSIIPFLNVGVQGFDKLIRSVKNNPAKVLFNATLYGVAPAAATTAYNLINFPKEYAEIPQYEKDSNFVLVKGRNANGMVDYVTFPKGNIIPSIANPVQSFMEFVAKNSQQTFQEMAMNLISSTLPVVGDGQSLAEIGLKTFGSNLPQAIKPLGENLLNKSFYKYDPKKEQTKDIVPYYLQNKPAYQQTYKFTPQMYQKIGALLNASPLKVQNLMEGYLAGYSKVPAQIVEMLTKTSRGEEVSPNEKTLLRRFIKQTYPGGSTKPITQPKAPGVMERITGKVGAVEQVPLPTSTKDLSVIYKDATRIINNYSDNKIKAQYGLVDKTLEEYQSEVDIAIATKKRIEQEQPDKVFEIQLETYNKNGGASTKDRTGWVIDQLKKTKDPNGLIRKLYDGQVLTQSVVEELNKTYKLGLAKYNYGDGYRNVPGSGKSKKSKKTISDAQILSAYKKALEAANPPKRTTSYLSELQRISKPIRLKRHRVKPLA